LFQRNSSGFFFLVLGDFYEHFWNKKNPERLFVLTIFSKFFPELFPENILAGYLDHEPVQDSGSRPSDLPWQHLTSEEITLGSTSLPNTP